MLNTIVNLKYIDKFWYIIVLSWKALRKRKTLYALTLYVAASFFLQFLIANFLPMQMKYLRVLVLRDYTFPFDKKKKKKTRTQFSILRDHFFQGVRFFSPPTSVKYFHHVKQFLCLEEKRISRISMHLPVTFSCICLTPVCFRDTGGGGIQLFEISIILESYRPRIPVARKFRKSVFRCSLVYLTRQTPVPVIWWSGLNVVCEFSPNFQLIRV